ncbi:RecQ family ATP-dependent DNA helicase [Candidatus Gracilibacteria bacterium]|nr:RecQ family ATP-dependent DNA helicase [Candidatus Gracilibacteria bacterium]
MKGYNLQSILQDIFGLDTFREGQQEIIEHIIEGNDTLVFMPTGGGKSLTYQFPGVVRDGLCIVISPLISLMKDQVDKLQSLGLQAELLNSTQNYHEQQQVLYDVENKVLQFLYIAPERLNSREFLQVLRHRQISLLAIDEAHCISQWGHDFRPSYMKVKAFIESLSGARENSGEGKRTFPIVALTATATAKVRTDIKERLGLTHPTSFISGFDRKNICIVVREISQKEEKQEKVFEIIQKTPGVGIVYCSSRKHVIELSEYLISKGIKTGVYKGDLSPDAREREQNAFMNDEYNVIVATNAFGMGIDKKDIRFVIHYNLPGSIESYYQEIGRAGRDGKMSYAVTLASYGDTKIQEFFIQNTYPGKTEILKFYEYLYKNMKLGEGMGVKLAKTQYVMASESGLGNDMKVGSIIKVLEKYDILERGMDGGGDDDFRGRGLTLREGKKRESDLKIDWNKQNYLEEEAYFKLTEMKKLLFYPQCRKRYILEYFGDTEDLAKLPLNCGLCDFCLEAKKYSSEDMQSFLPLSSYEVILESVKKYNEKFGQTIFTKMLLGSGDQKLTDWSLIYYEHYGALKTLEREIISAMFEALIEYGFLEKTHGRYPMMMITSKGQTSLRREQYIKDELGELNGFVMHKIPKKKINSSQKSSKKLSPNSSSTYNETLDLLSSGKTLSEIATLRKLTPQTIESHVIKLYESKKLPLAQVLELTHFNNIKAISQVLTEEEQGLKEIKEIIESRGELSVSYFDIKLTCAMREMRDI